MMTASLTSSDMRWWWPRDAVPPLADIRHRLAGYLSELGRDVVLDAQLVCTELMTNVHLHARSAGQLRVAKTPGGKVVHIEVSDDSPVMPKVPRRLRLSAPNGRGLMLVNALAKRWGVKRNRRGKTVWADVPTG